MRWENHPRVTISGPEGTRLHGHRVWFECVHHPRGTRSLQRSPLTPTPAPGIPDPLSVSTALSLLHMLVNGSARSVAFCAWLLSRSVVSSKPTHVVAGLVLPPCSWSSDTTPCGWTELCLSFCLLVTLAAVNVESSHFIWCSPSGFLCSVVTRGTYREPPNWLRDC